jgi:NitT/TauT family transport system permease protein
LTTPIARTYEDTMERTAIHAGADPVDVKAARAEQSAAGPTSPRDRDNGMRRLRGPLTYVGSALVALAAWQLVLWVFDPPSFILPTPAAVIEDFVRGVFVIPMQDGLLHRRGYLLPLVQTLQPMLVGYVLGAGLAIAVAVVLAAFRALDRLVLPIITAFQSLPKIALAPLFVVWFGFGPGFRTILVVAVVFFPVLINARAGLFGVDEGRIMMARAFGTSPLKIMWKIRIPSALPYVFTGLELGAIYALLGTIVAEFTAGGEGLGARMLALQYANLVAGMFSILIIFALVGATAHRIVSLVHKKVVFWSPEAEADV